MDLIALGQVMLTPEDDLSLACVLKSPLIGLSEDELYQLSRSRLHEKYETSLFEALHVADEPNSAQAYALLTRWRDHRGCPARLRILCQNFRGQMVVVANFMNV